MTGLLIKDFRLLKVQKNFFTLIVFILLGMILFLRTIFLLSALPPLFSSFFPQAQSATMNLTTGIRFCFRCRSQEKGMFSKNTVSD